MCSKKLFIKTYWWDESVTLDTYYLIFSYFINSFAAASGPLKTSQSKHPSPQESSDGTGILKYRYATGYWKGKLGSSNVLATTMKQKWYSYLWAPDECFASGGAYLDNDGNTGPWNSTLQILTHFIH